MCNYCSMHATDVKAIDEATRKEVGPAEKDTAARLTALMHHIFLYDRGNQLRVIEETGLSMTQCKVLLELGGLGARRRRPGRSATWPSCSASRSPR